MSTWTSRRRIDAPVDEVMEALTDPGACRSWSPVPFSVDALGGERLTSGDRVTVSGRLGAVGVSFAVTVLEAGAERLALTALGPVSLEVEYEAFAGPDGDCELWATVNLRAGGGLTGRVVAAGTEALLRAGALDLALERIDGCVGVHALV